VTFLVFFFANLIKNHLTSEARLQQLPFFFSDDDKKKQKVDPPPHSSRPFLSLEKKKET
jgi:hypothetical protein